MFSVVTSFDRWNPDMLAVRFADCVGCAMKLYGKSAGMSVPAVVQCHPPGFLSFADFLAGKTLDNGLATAPNGGDFRLRYTCIFLA